MKIEKPELVDFILKDVNSNILKNYIKDIEKENERLQNIIKEVREYINWRLEEHQDMYKYQMEELLEILGSDKE